jgi:hypothetical protein
MALHVQNVQRCVFGARMPLTVRTSQRLVRVANAAPSRNAVAQGSPDTVFVQTRWLSEHMFDVSIVDVRGSVETKEIEPGVEKSMYQALKDDYLHAHIPVRLELRVPSNTVH